MTDGVAVAVEFAGFLVALGLTTSRAGGHEKPLPKERRWGRRPDGEPEPRNAGRSQGPGRQT